MNWWQKTLSVVFAVVLTAVGIEATNTLEGTKGSLLSNFIGGQNEICPSGMVEAVNVPGVKCVDIYEASAGPLCAYQDPSQQLETSNNLDRESCNVLSQSGVMPWRAVSREQASLLCSRSGKRLPTAKEWHAIALGTVSENCNLTGSSPKETGSHAGCVSSVGAADVVGNVWEWVSDDILDGHYSGRRLPPSGYVVSTDQAGMALETSKYSGRQLYEDDYFWSRSEGNFGILRGGYYNSGTNGGVYSANAHTRTDFVGEAVGFRCVI